MPTRCSDLLPTKHITRPALVIRGYRVLLDSELAELYDVPTHVLNRAVKRNAERFPNDHVFRLNRAETKALQWSRFVCHSQKQRNRRLPPFAFTGQGAIKAAMILNSPRAIEVSIYVVRALVTLREALVSNADPTPELYRLERTLQPRDPAIASIINAIRQLRNPSPSTNRPIRSFTH